MSDEFEIHEFDEPYSTHLFDVEVVTSIVIVKTIRVEATNQKNASELAHALCENMDINKEINECNFDMEFVTRDIEEIS